MDLVVLFVEQLAFTVGVLYLHVLITGQKRTPSSEKHLTIQNTARLSGFQS